MKIVEKLQAIMDKLPALIESGKKRQKIDMWDAYQQGGQRTDYAMAFAGAGWNRDAFAPRHDMVPEDADKMFFFHNNPLYNEEEVENPPEAYDLVERLEELGITLDFSGCQSMGQCFKRARITHLGVVNLSGIHFDSITKTDDTVETEDGRTLYRYHIDGKERWCECFAGSHLKRIDKLLLSVNHPLFGNNFFPESLEEIGEITGPDDDFVNPIRWPLYLAHCPNITHDTLVRIITALSDVKISSFYNGGDPEWNCYKLHLGDTNLAKLTEEEIAIATGKGWIVLGDPVTEEGDGTEGAEAQTEPAADEPQEGQ